MPQTIVDVVEHEILQLLCAWLPGHLCEPVPRCTTERGLRNTPRSPRGLCTCRGPIQSTRGSQPSFDWGIFYYLFEHVPAETRFPRKKWLLIHELGGAVDGCSLPADLANLKIDNKKRDRLSIPWCIPCQRLPAAPYIFILNSSPPPPRRPSPSLVALSLFSSLQS